MFARYLHLQDPRYFIEKVYEHEKRLGLVLLLPSRRELNREIITLFERLDAQHRASPVGVRELWFPDQLDIEAAQKRGHKGRHQEARQKPAIAHGFARPKGPP